MKHVCKGSAVVLTVACLAWPTAHGALPSPEIKVLSNRADLISGGDALVEIKWPAGTNPALSKIALNGRPLTGVFAQRANGRYMGLVTGLVEGANVLTARVPGAGAQITITNHSSGGPVFAGAQLQPWVCATQPSMTVNITGNAGQQGTVNTNASGLSTNPATNDPPGASKCETPPDYSYYYKRASAPANCTFALTGANACFTAYTPGNPATVPADAADITNDRGDTVKYLIRVERGSMNRGIYQLVTLYDPRDANVAWAPPKGWNQKLYWRFGGGGGVGRFESAPNVSTIMFQMALERGFMVGSSPMTDGGSNTNNTLSAETFMMVKERISEQYGEIRYAMSDGGSGGSIMQHQISTLFPGLLQGIQTTQSFPDEKSAHMEIVECGLLQATSTQNPGYPGYFNRTAANGGPQAPLTDAQRAAINGHMSPAFCNSWTGAFLNVDIARVNNCGNIPVALRYNPATNPAGLRCTVTEHVQSLIGTFTDVDGVVKAQHPYDNVGVQYGLNALASSVITPEQFVHLNENIGGYDLDLVPTPGRMETKPDVLRTYYTGGLVTDGKQLGKVAIIENRGQNGLNGDVHMNWRSLAIRERLDRANGGHGNHMLWTSENSGQLTAESFNTLDAWLRAIEVDAGPEPLELKVLRNKPGVAGSSDGDFCQLSSGTRIGIFDANCPVKYFGSPRTAAGGPMAENVFKCQLRPFDPNSPAYNGAVFSTEQIARLRAVFPSGVCDWTVPGVSQIAATPNTTFAAGPGGQPLGQAPTSTPIP